MEECKSVDLESISSSKVKIIQKYLQAASGSAIVGMDNKVPKNNYLGVQPSHILVEGSQSKKAKKKWEKHKSTKESWARRTYNIIR